VNDIYVPQTTSCINITAPGITFHNERYVIHGDLPVQYGIYTNQPNTRIIGADVNLPLAAETISVKNTGNVLIQNAKVKTGYIGINLENVSMSSVINSEVRDNRIDGFFHGININGGGNNRILHNKVTNNSATFWYASGFSLVQSNDNLLIGNEVVDLEIIPGPIGGFAYGVNLIESKRNIFINSRFEKIREGLGGGGFGIAISLEHGSDENSFANTYIAENQVGISLGGGAQSSVSNVFKGGNIRSNLLGLSIYSARNNHISDFAIENSSIYGIVLGNFISENTISDTVVSMSGVDLYVYEHENNGTLLENSVIRSYSFFFSGAPINIKNQYGEIRFMDRLNGSGQDLTQELQIMRNSAVIDASSNPGLDRPAKITLRNVLLPYEPNSISILNDGEVCRECQVISWDPKTMTAIFNVPGQGNYSLR
jgi:hypothetical protein